MTSLTLKKISGPYLFTTLTEFWSSLTKDRLTRPGEAKVHSLDYSAFTVDSLPVDEVLDSLRSGGPRPLQQLFVG